MASPAHPPEFVHTCPVCNRPVKPGYKFCEVCGTRIPSLYTCSKCGTQFLHPKKFCDLCGTPFNLEENKEPDEENPPEPEREELPEPDQPSVPEPAEETPRQPESNDVPEPDEEERPQRYEKKAPGHYPQEIREPDTDELLRLYGEDEGEEEKPESSHKQKAASQKQLKEKNPVASRPSARGSAEAVEDALFFPDKEPAPVKPFFPKLKIIGLGVVLIVVLAAFFFIGLPMLTGNGGANAPGSVPGATTTPTAQPVIVNLTETPAPVNRALMPLPTQQIPTDQKYFFQVQTNPVTSTISVNFIGSAGAGSITSADVKVTHEDGSVTTGIIQPLKGVSDITLAGSTGINRVEIIAKMSSGATYRVYDDLLHL